MEPVVGGLIIYAAYRLFTGSDDNDKKPDEIKQEKPDEKVCTCKRVCICKE